MHPAGPRPRRQRRKQQRAVNKLATKVQRAMTNEMLDTVLAGYSYQDNMPDSGSILRTPDPVTPTTQIEIKAKSRLRVNREADEMGQRDALELIHLHNQLFPRDLAIRIQTILEQFAGRAFSNAEMNRELVTRINQILRGSGCNMIFPETGQKVRLRFISPPRAKAGYFQLRTSDSMQQAIYTKTQFPTLQITSQNQ